MARRPRARRRLLVLGAGPAQLGLLEAARARGDLEVIAVDRDPQAVGFALVDERAVLSTEDEEAVDRHARATDVDGHVSPRSDWPVGNAARLICWRSGVIRTTSQARWQRSSAVISHAPGSSCQRPSP